MKLASVFSVVCVPLFLSGCSTSRSASSPDATTVQPRIVLIAAEPEYDSPGSLRAFAEDLKSTLGAETVVLTPAPAQDSVENVPGMEHLDSADLLVVFARFQRIPADQLVHLQRYLERGGPVIGIRTSTHAFAYDAASPLACWNAFGPRVLGAPWIYHYGHESSTDVAVAPGAEHEPLLEGVAPFHARSWLYALTADTPTLGAFPPRDAHVLLVGTSVDRGRGDPVSRPRDPVAWTRVDEWGGRVFTTTLGHPDDFKLPEFRRLLLNGARWALQDLGVRRARTADLPAHK